MADYPFLFYGCRPRDWQEETSAGHFYEVRFRDVPSAVIKAQLGRMWGERTSDGAVTSGEWLWCGRWALAQVGERPGGQSNDFFDKMTELFCNVHAFAPISEVLFWGATDLSLHPWDRWTVAQQPQPSPAPAYAGLAAQAAIARPRDPALGTPARDADFDRGRAAAERVDARPALDLGDAVARIDAFLHSFTRHAEYFEDGWPLLIVLLVSVNDDETGVEILFSCDGSASERLEALCERAIAALERAHPNLGFPFGWELVPG
jgi:hypothetical protein